MRTIGRFEIVDAVLGLASTGAAKAHVIDRRDLPTRKLLTVLLGQHLQLELRTAIASLGPSPSMPCCR
jgi:hypothetical protein